MRLERHRVAAPTIGGWFQAARVCYGPVVSDWFRNTAWDDSIQAAFDAKLAQCRTQRAQYLRVQGSILKESHPGAALALLRRCIETGDEFQVAPAHLDSAGPLHAQ